jgi:hypothetical protein
MEGRPNVNRSFGDRHIGIASTSDLAPTTSRRFDTPRSRYEGSACRHVVPAPPSPLVVRRVRDRARRRYRLFSRRSIPSPGAGLRHGRRIRPRGSRARPPGSGGNPGGGISRSAGAGAPQRAKQRVRPGHTGAMGRIERLAVSAGSREGQLRKVARRAPRLPRQRPLPSALTPCSIRIPPT